MHRPLADSNTPPSVFHTRQLTYPVLVTVYHMLECHGMDILPFEGAEDHGSDWGEVTGGGQALLSVGDEAGWCLFSIDVRNTYGLPFEVTFERDQEGVRFMIILSPSCVLTSILSHTGDFNNFNSSSRLDIKVCKVGHRLKFYLYSVPLGLFYQSRNSYFLKIM